MGVLLTKIIDIKNVNILLSCCNPKKLCLTICHKAGVENSQPVPNSALEKSVVCQQVFLSTFKIPNFRWEFTLVPSTHNCLTLHPFHSCTSPIIPYHARNLLLGL